MWRAGTVSELFRLRELGLSVEEEKEVEAFIVKHPRKVALVCDGLDEGSVDEDSFLWRVLTRECLPGLRVIVTSRPCAAVSNLSMAGAFDRHLQLFAFNAASVRTFVVKYLGEGEGEKMLLQLAKRPAMSSLMHTPFFALLICEQFKNAGQLPQRRSDIFSSVTLRVVQRYAKRQGLKSTFKCAEKAPGELFNKLLEVGKVAFDRLKRKDLSYFELEDEDLSSEAVELGFLEHVQSTSLSEEGPVRFSAPNITRVPGCSVRLQGSVEESRRRGEVGEQARVWSRSRSFEHVLGVCGRSTGQRPPRGTFLRHRWDRHANSDQKHAGTCHS